MTFGPQPPFDLGNPERCYREIWDRARLNDIMSRPDTDFIMRPHGFPRWLWAVLYWCCRP